MAARTPPGEASYRAR